MIQFPAAPVVGQIFSPLPGVSYKFDGTGWGINLAGTPTGDLSVIGKIQVSGQGLFADGTLVAPGISWSSEPTSGFSRGALNTFFYSVAGLAKIQINPNTLGLDVDLQVNKKFNVSDRATFSVGSLVGPGICFINDTSSGWYSPGAGIWDFSSQGVNVFDLRGNTVQSLIQHRFIPGTAAAPGLAFTNDPTTGIWSNGPGNLNFTVSGINHLIIQAGIVATDIPFSGTNFTAINSYTASYTANSATSLHSTGILSRGAGAPGTIRLVSSDGSTLWIPYQWIPTVGSAGQHTFANLQGAGNSFFKIFGGSFAAGEGSCLTTYYGSAAISAIDTSLQDGTPGSLKSTLNFYVAKSSVGVTNPDVSLLFNSNLRPQFKINGSWANTLPDGVNCPLLISDPINSAGAAGICLRQANVGNGVVWTLGSNIGTSYWGGLDNTGALGGWAANLSSSGTYTATAFTPISDAELKEDIRPLVNSLARLLQLHGVNYRQKWDQNRSTGLLSQDVMAVFPELVGDAKGPNDGDPTYKTLNYMGLIGPMVEAIRELNTRISKLEIAPK